MGARCGCGVGGFVAGGREDIGGGAHGRGGVIDGAHLGHSFAVAFLALGPSGGELGGGRGCGCGGRRAQRVGAHDDALAVAGEHEHVVAGPGWRLAGGVEGFDVDRGPLGERLDLAFAQSLPGGLGDPGDRVVVGAAGGFGDREAAQPV